MLCWKLLGDLLPNELRLECERAGLKVSEKESHNFVKLAKYILSNGYDPEDFFFNTYYQSDKSSPLVGMINDSQAKSPNAGGTASRGPSSTRLLGSSLPPSSDESSTALFGLFSKMSKDIEKLVSIMEVKKTATASGVGVDRSEQRSPSPDLPFWDSLESVTPSVSSVSSSEASSGYSRSSDFFGRRYDKSMLIEDRICLAYQHGNCIYADQAIRHENAFGQNVLHYCGLCWTDSPDNQCYYPAAECPGPEHNL